MEIFIVAAKRTPIGKFNGYASGIPVSDLCSQSIRVTADEICFNDKICNDEKIFAYYGCVLQAGVGQNPCRQAILKSGINGTYSTVTINQVCGSGITSLNQAYNYLLNNKGIAIAGGMENMSNAPYLLDKARFGYRLGGGAIIDHMQKDGLEDPYFCSSMISLAEGAAKDFDITRSDAESFALMSFERVNSAISKKFFENEITKVNKIGPKGENLEFISDEVVSQVLPEKFQKLKPIVEGGILTPATISAISDGAATIILCDEETLKEKGFTPLAKIKGFGYSSVPSKDFTKAPVFATKNLCEKLAWNLDDIDAFEVNEAFATVPIIFSKSLNVPFSKINISGGACSLGHPIGCSGARIIVTLINNLKVNNMKKGIASICVGSGEGVSIAIEIL